MSDLTATPQSSPTPAGTQSPQRVEGANQARDDTHPEEKPNRQPERRTKPESRGPKAYDPAVSVAPSIAHLKPGTTVTGKIERVDGDGRPILDAREGVYALRPDAGLKPGDEVTIVLNRVERKITGEVTIRAGQPVEPPIKVNLTLIGLKHLPAGPPIEADVSGAPPTLFHYNAPPGAGAQTTDFELTSLSIARGPDASVLVKSGTGPSATATAPPGSPPSRSDLLRSTLVAQEPDLAGPPVASDTGKAGGLEDRVISAHVAGTAPAADDPGLFSPGQAVLLRLSAPGGGREIGDFAIKTEGVIVTASKAAGETVVEAVDPAKQLTADPVTRGNDRHYLETPLATFVFRADVRLEPGTRLTVAVAPAGQTATAREQTGAARTSESDPPKAHSQQSPTSRVSASPGPIHSSVYEPGAAAVVKGRESTAETSRLAVRPLPAPRQSLPELPPAWQVLGQIYAALLQSAPESAAALAGRIPGSQTAFSNGLLFVLASMGANLPRTLLGETAARGLERNDRSDLIARLSGEIARLFRTAGGEVAGGEWRYLPIPFQTQDGVQSLYLFWKPEDGDGQASSDDGSEEDSENQAKRFIVDVSFGRLGRIQLDGFYRPTRLDVHLRSAEPLPAHMRGEIETLFQNALEAGGLTGRLDFAELKPPPVEIAGLLKRDQTASHPDLLA